MSSKISSSSSPYGGVSARNASYAKVTATGILRVREALREDKANLVINLNLMQPFS